MDHDTSSSTEDQGATTTTLLSVLQRPAAPLDEPPILLNRPLHQFQGFLVGVDPMSEPVLSSDGGFAERFQLQASDVRYLEHIDEGDSWRGR